MESPIIPFHIAYGKSALFGTYGLAPFKIPITVVVGKPIHVMQMVVPNESYVEQIHKEYVEALLALYNQFNAEYGNSNKTLIIT